MSKPIATQVPAEVQLALGQSLTALWNAGLLQHDRTQQALHDRLCQLLLAAAAEGNRATAARLGRQLRAAGWRVGAVLAWEMGRALWRKNNEAATRAA